MDGEKAEEEEEGRASLWTCARRSELESEDLERFGLRPNRLRNGNFVYTLKVSIVEFQAASE